MNGYSLVIDISSDEENNRKSTPLKTLPLNTIGTLSDSSVEVYRGSDADLESTFGSDDSPRKFGPSPKKKKKFGRVTFNLSTANSDTDDYYEEPPFPQEQSSRAETASTPKGKIPLLGNERVPNTVRLNDLNEPPLADLDALNNLDLEDRQFSATARRGRGLKAMECPRQPPFLPRRKENVPPTEGKEKCNCTLGNSSKPSGPPEFCPAVWAQIEKEGHEMEEEEKLIAKMKEGRGLARGRRLHNGRPPIIIRKEIPHCNALPLSLGSRGALSRPAPGRNFYCCSGIPGFGRGRGQGRGKLY